MLTIICPHCGVNNRTGSNFCNNCGTELRESDRVEARQPQPNDSKTNKAIDQAIIDPKLEAGTVDAPTEHQPPESHASEQSAGGIETETRLTEPQDLPSVKAVESSGRQAEESLSNSDEASELTPPIINENRDDSPNELLPQRDTGSGIPGLLEPQTIIGETIEDLSRPQRTGGSVGDTDLRRIQTLMTSEPSIKTEKGPSAPNNTPSIRIPWIFALLALSLAIPIFLEFSGPTGVGNELPGVAAAFQTIDRLDTPIVLLLWEYDPATAGELDQVIEPVLRHLEDKGYQVVLASTLPTGPATARRVLREVHNDQGRNSLLTSLDLGYLPGGAAILPLLGQDRGAILPPNERTQSALLSSPLDLVLIASARAEEVQQWLEQGQPLNQTTTIAVISAAADPYLRPFLDSGQLSGIVSGFDGGIAYHQLYNRSHSATSTTADATPSPQQFRQQIYQNWGHFTIFLLILLGNFSMLSNRGTQNKQEKNRTVTEHTNV